MTCFAAFYTTVQTPPGMVMIAARKICSTASSKSSRIALARFDLVDRLHWRTPPRARSKLSLLPLPGLFKGLLVARQLLQSGNSHHHTLQHLGSFLTPLLILNQSSHSLGPAPQPNTMSSVTDRKIRSKSDCGDSSAGCDRIDQLISFKSS